MPHYEVNGPLPGNQAGAIGLVQNGKALEHKSLKLVGKNGDAYSYVQEFSPLNQKLPVRLTTYTMPQIEFYKELEMRIPIR